MAAARDAAAEPRDGAADFGVTQQRRRVHDGDGVVGRKVLPVVFEHRQIQRVDQPRGRIAGDDIDLPFGERAVHERQVHDARRLAEAQTVGRREPAVAVGPIQELVAECGAPARRVRRQLRQPRQSPRARVRGANQNRERVAEAERRQHRSAGVGVQLADLVEHHARITLNGLLEDGGQRGAAVFDVQVDVAGLNRAVADERAAEIEPPIDGKPCVALDRLRHQLAENHLLGEVLGADDDALGPRPGGEGGAASDEKHERGRRRHARDAGLVCVCATPAPRAAGRRPRSSPAPRPARRRRG